MGAVYDLGDDSCPVDDIVVDDILQAYYWAAFFSLAVFLVLVVAVAYRQKETCRILSESHMDNTRQEETCRILSESHMDNMIQIGHDSWARMEQNEQVVIPMKRGEYAAVSTELQKDKTLVFREFRCTEDDLEILNRELGCNEDDIYAHPMTGLEYSIFLGDGKMALIFFLRGADPIHNTCNGEIATAEVYGAAPDVMPNFTRDGTIPGFRGLRALIQPHRGNRPVVEQYLWLMELCGSSRLGRPGTLQEHLVEVSAAFRSISAASHWRHELAGVLHVRSLCLHRAVAEATGSALPASVMWAVVEFAADDVLACVRSSLRALVREYV